MSETIDHTPESEAPSAEHRAWLDEKIKTAMDKKARGEARYTPFQDVLQEFGFSCRQAYGWKTSSE